MAHDLIERAKAEQFLILPTVLAEDSMQSTAKSTKAKCGPARKKPKASDYRLNQ